MSLPPCGAFTTIFPPETIIYALLPVGRSLETSMNASSDHGEIPHIIQLLIYDSFFFLLNSLMLSLAPLAPCRTLMGLFCNVLPREDNRILQTASSAFRFVVNRFFFQDFHVTLIASFLSVVQLWCLPSLFNASSLSTSPSVALRLSVQTV